MEGSTGPLDKIYRTRAIVQTGEFAISKLADDPISGRCRTRTHRFQVHPRIALRFIVLRYTCTCPHSRAPPWPCPHSTCTEGNILFMQYLVHSLLLHTRRLQEGEVLDTPANVSCWRLASVSRTSPSCTQDASCVEAAEWTTCLHIPNREDTFRRRRDSTGIQPLQCRTRWLLHREL